MVRTCISCGAKPHALLPMKNRSYAVCNSCKSAIKIDRKKFGA